MLPGSRVCAGAGAGAAAATGRTLADSPPPAGDTHLLRARHEQARSSCLPDLHQHDERPHQVFFFFLFFLNFIFLPT